MSGSQRRLRIAGEAPIGGTGAPSPEAKHCGVTGLTIPECSCTRCATEQIRKHAPWVLGGEGDTGRHGHAA
ncbi:MAG TPA: hypothetical protein VKA36_07400 [Solirubrobacterales bacterium]|nr:hypothetical protein [Solirubrobacterales bacterium]